MVHIGHPRQPGLDQPVILLAEGSGDSLPNTAMASGTPVVASNTTSIPELVGDAGLLCDPRSPAEFADASTPQTDPAANAIRERAAAELKKSGLGPRAIGEQVLAAIRDERFYILTHPELNPVIEQRMQDILTGNNPAAVPSPGLMQKLNALRPR